MNAICVKATYTTVVAFVHILTCIFSGKMSSKACHNCGWNEIDVDPSHGSGKQTTWDNNSSNTIPILDFQI